jgi:hypothetical protein
MPVHAHNAAEGLKPEGIAQPGQELIVAVVEENAFRDGRSESGHARREPGRNVAAVERQIRNSGALHNSIETLWRKFEEKFLVTPIQILALSDMSHT